MPYTLAYKDRFYSLAENMPEANPSVPHCGDAFAFGTLEETGNKLLLQVSAEEMQVLFSSALQGCQLLYPEKAQTLLEILLRTVDCGDYLTTLCQDIADCIDNPSSPSYTSVTNISNEVSNTNIENNNTIINTDRNLEPEAPNFLEKRFKELDRQDPVLPEDGTCNDARKNEIYAGCLEIVSRLSEMAQDFLEDVNSQADAVQRAARTVALVPLIGDALGESILNFAELIPDILNAYNSHDSLAQHEDVACELFCMHASECGYPTFQELIDYYKSVGISGIGDIAAVSMQALIDAVLGTTGLANEVIWYAMNTFVLYFLMVEGTVMQRRGTKWIRIYAGNGELLPNDDWMILCDDCAPTPTSWQWSYPATTCTYGLPSGWAINIGAASCGNGIGAFDGIYRTRTSVAAEVQVTITMPAAQAVYSVNVNAIVNLVSGFNDGTLNVKVFDGATQVYDSSQTMPRTGFVAHNFTPNVIGTSIVIYGVQTYLSQNPTGVCFNKISVNAELL